MEVSITRFRQNIFALVDEALNGSEIWVTYRGRRFQIAPENKRAGRLAKLTPLKVVNSHKGQKDSCLLEEMTRAWERDWADL